MALESHYDVLGVARSADRDIIRAACRVLAKRYHPDTATSPRDMAAARFRKIQGAYEVLSDARQRAKYDAQLDAAARELQTAAASPTTNPGTAAASLYWRGVGYLLIILVLGGILGAIADFW
jgi:DnaJ-class molecular chaperone